LSFVIQLSKTTKITNRKPNLLSNLLNSYRSRKNVLDYNLVSRLHELFKVGNGLKQHNAGLSLSALVRNNYRVWRLKFWQANTALKDPITLCSFWRFSKSYREVVLQRFRLHFEFNFVCFYHPNSKTRLIIMPVVIIMIIDLT